MWADEFMTESPVAPTAVSSRQPEARVPSRPPPEPPIAMLGVAFDNLTLTGTLERIEEMVASRQPHYVVTANVDFLVQAQRDVELRRILNDAHLVLCDGTPLVWASRLLGNPLPERVAGSDLVPQLIRVAAERRYRLFFLGAAPDANAEAVRKVREEFPDAIIAGHYSPPFRPLLEMDHAGLAERIRAAAPDILLVSFGCPKAEKWISMHYRSLGVPVTIGVGATIDFLAGRLKRAPRWMRQAGVEWVFRMVQEPRRLVRRYVTDLWRFGGAMLAQVWHTWPHGRRPHESIRRPVMLTESTWQRLCMPESLQAGTVRREAAVWEAAGERHCLLDLADVRSIDSTGVGLLLRLRRRLLAAGRSLVLVSPSQTVRQALRAMRLESLFISVADALEARQRIAAETIPPVVVNGVPRPLRWRGEITASNAHGVWNLTEPSLRALCARQGTVTIDLSEVRFIDSTALGVMVRAKKAAEEHGAVLRFTGAQANVRNVVRLAELGTLLAQEGVA